MSIPKNIVYLLGAGSTQAEIDYRGGKKINLLMKDSSELGEGVATRILKTADIFKLLKINAADEIDVEKLISLLSASHTNKYKKIAEKLRKYYFKVIVKDLLKSKVNKDPELMMSLFELHKNDKFKTNVEKLSGFIVLNHDNLCQIASERIYHEVNLGFKFKCSTLTCTSGISNEIPLIIKLYGSFDWKNNIPIKINNLDSKSKYSPDMLWIPPSILKEGKDYPYNKLAALAYEILAKRCDVLRIIGCSLSQNDWNVISLLFNAQYSQFLFKKSCFKIELIMNQSTGSYIKKNCSYLQNVFPIEFLADGDFSDFSVENESDIPKTSALNNPFLIWLKRKTLFHTGKKEIDLNETVYLKKILEES